MSDQETSLPDRVAHDLLDQEAFDKVWQTEVIRQLSELRVALAQNKQSADLLAQAIATLTIDIRRLNEGGRRRG
jgi:hypothetical protein